MLLLLFQAHCKSLEFYLYLFNEESNKKLHRIISHPFDRKLGEKTSGNTIPNIYKHFPILRSTWDAFY